MILGMSLGTFTTVHVALSLIELASGAIVAFGLWRAVRQSRWITLFLCSSALTSVTGFLFPVSRIKPSHVVGAISIVLTAVVALALYKRELKGAWRPVYAGAVLATVYLDAFVAVVQAFQKIPVFRALAPNGSGPFFGVAQVGLLAGFAAFGVIAVRRFRAGARMDANTAVPR